MGVAHFYPIAVNKPGLPGVLLNVTYMHSRPHAGIPDANTYLMKNATLEARVRRILTREFYRRGRLTWDMKMALQRALAGRS